MWRHGHWLQNQTNLARQRHGRNLQQAVNYWRRPLEGAVAEVFTLRFMWGEAGASDTHTHTHTSAQAVGPSEDSALLDLSECRKHHPDVVLVAFLGHHADEQLPVFHRCRQNQEEEEEEEDGEQGEGTGGKFSGRKSLDMYFQTIGVASSHVNVSLVESVN